MATYTPVPIKIAEKSKPKSVQSLVQIVLESVKKDSRGFFLWHNLIEQFEQHFRLTRIQAAIEIRKLINQGRLFLVPCWMTSNVYLTLDASILTSKVYSSEKENREFAEQDAKYLKELTQLNLKDKVENRNRNRRNENPRRRYQKDREELLRK